ncbi:LacI family DNA-binding transcriptional regulator [Shimia sp. R9_2]|uniref:LacI family DNA-binding transcriptional regulator n=1 Tax=Shimia sp. R9_2 TaxID=2821112 RepID=UPI001FFE0A68|nr:LacI family DNA-binding transcriptional regulator [Shimia sp. R9_2]
MSAIRHPSEKDMRAPQNRAGRRVTINDLAAHLGMSKSTVSRAMNGYADISESTRKRVASTAQKLGYQPLSHAQAIRTGRVRALALVLQMDEPDRHNPFLQEFLMGACETASGFGWTVTVSTATSDADMQNVLGRLVDERKADGFILPRTEVKDARISLLQARGVPHVLFGRTEHGVPTAQQKSSWYDILGEAAMCSAVTRLAGLGHERIGYVGSTANFNYTHLRREGFKAGLAAAGLTYDAELLREGARTREEGAEEVHALMRLERPPTGVVFATDMAALGGYDALSDLGLQVGRDVSVIGYDGVPEADYVRPGLTTYHVDTRKAGARLAELLIRQIRGESPETLREVSDAILVERLSDGPPALRPDQLAEKIKNTQ